MAESFARHALLMAARLASSVGMAHAAAPAWAYPVKASGILLPASDDGRPIRVPGSSRSFTQAQIEEAKQ